MKKHNNISASFLRFSAVAASLLCLATATSASDNTPKQDAPKNIIMVIADGMGPAYVSAYRYYNDDPNTEAVETTVFDDMLIGTARTYPHGDSGYVTDSAASATALAAGVKTYNGAIGMDVNKQPQETVLHRARKQGMKTGLAVTSTIVHATPASYMVANEQRRNYAQIADSFFDDRIDGKFLADVMLGAGTDHFIREDRDVVSEFVANGYQYITAYDELASVATDKPLLGLFAPQSLPWSLDDSDPLRLNTLTKAALEQLDNKDGFFLLVEASQVDWAGHGNEIASAMAEMTDLVATMNTIKAFTATNPDTLVILTADHSTGGLTVAGEDGYRWDPKWLKGVKASVPEIAKGVLSRSLMESSSNSSKQNNEPAAFVAEMFGFELTETEVASVQSISSDMKPRDAENVLKRILDERTNTGWTTIGHTAVDVNVFGYGPGIERFSGNIDNVDIAHGIFELLDVRQSPANSTQ
ncbi:alkaline phosphatase [Glaciecola siphonariae]|uniref:Alkaline phosphatase n=1 Tax=Glaciecola siphonariae TaxID=521012 RepID=A0ABV9M0L3_9ALTE